MSFPPVHPSGRRFRSGMALVIVLAFVVLLTGLVLAFFSRALNERQISNSSVNQVKVDVLARGAVSAVIGDLQQEIAAGSTPYPLPSPTPAQGSATIFVPSVPATMIPALALASPTPTPAAPPAPTGLENLVKQSAGGIPFYPATNYNTSNFPPSARAAKSVSGTGASGENNTTRASLSGRYISAARWNKPLLMPVDPDPNKTYPTPLITGGTFVPPDWVLVARDGSNPSAWNSSLTASLTNTTTVVGRYAYNVYDEGGLLDANVAGYPALAYPADPSNPAPTPLPTPPTRKSSVAYADLTVPVTLPGGGTQSLMTAKEINALVGWRNYASSRPVGGSFPNYTPSPAQGNGLTFFDAATLLVSNGYLSASNSNLYNNGFGLGSDRMFEGRQQLIDFLLQGVAANDTTGTERARLQNSLMYLSTYSRGLSQPAFYRAQATDNTLPGYDPSAPQLLNTYQGGNNAGPDNASGTHLDAAINPSFLNVRVKTSVKASSTTGRFDGSDLVAGEPLVKKRFSLNRLAWLTFAGPIASHDHSTLNPTGNRQVATVITTLENQYGFTEPFLKQGNDTNIQNYFGLSWGPDPLHGGVNCWSYKGHNRGGATGPICKLSYLPDSLDVLRANREADFFELLKASVNVGSLAKVGTVTSASPDGTYSKLIPSYVSQYADDSRVDDAIIQMGANIIDQFDLDAYPTCINFNDGGTNNGKDFYGVENLPYLSRLAHALVKVKQTDTSVTNPATGAIADTGVGALLQCPVLWNPHDYTANQDQTMGVVGPTLFRIYADSSVYPVNNTIQLYGIVRDQPTTSSNLGRIHPSMNQTKCPSWNTKYGFPVSAEIRPLTKDNTALYFSNKGRDVTLFREPTILYRTTSSGTGLVDSTQLPARGGYNAIGGTAGFFTSDGSFRSDVNSGIAGIPPVAGQGYVGFYLGAVPLYWADNSGNNPFYWTDEVAVVTPVNVDYHLQYQDINQTWVDYDVKRRSMGGGGGIAESSGISGTGDRSAGANGWMSFIYDNYGYGTQGSPPLPNVTNINHYNCSFAAMDPRTGRFGMMKLTAGKFDTAYWTFPPFGAYTPATATRTATPSKVGFYHGWINAGAGQVLGLRSGTSDGTPFMCPLGVFPTSMGWNPGSVSSASAGQRFVACDNSTPAVVLGQTTGNHMCRPEIFAQNNPFARRDNQPMGDDGESEAADSTFAPPGVSNAAQFYTDADGVVRRATGGLVPFATSGPAATSDVGLPTTPANQPGLAPIPRLSQSDSRPVVLNRPFRSVGELSYTFSGTPWKNINFTMPESGDTALLDVFCVNDTDDVNGLMAGQVNLNTRQVPVLQAILAGAYKDEWNPGTTNISGTLPATIANALVARTTSTAAGKGPLQNVSELVGKWVGNNGTTGISGGASSPIFSPTSYNGFSADLIDNIPRPPSNTVTPGVLASDPNIAIPRFANATMRALAACGQTRVWNLLIDVIAQTGRYPQSAASLDKFSVEGEQRYWVHLAIDRLTGQVIDKQIEVVKE